MALTIGTLTWTSCDKCIHFDGEMGCMKIDDIEIMEENGFVVCLTGEESEGPDIMPEFEVWE